VQFNLARKDFLKGLWNKNMTKFEKKLKKRQKETLKSIDPKLIDTFLDLYLQRCKFKHTIVFMQFRKLLPKPKLHDLMDIFFSRKEFFL
jgi:hypothetical protein